MTVWIFNLTQKYWLYVRHFIRFRNSPYYWNFLQFVLKLCKDQCSHNIETNQLICSVNQHTGFCIMQKLFVKGLIKILKDIMFIYIVIHPESHRGNLCLRFLIYILVLFLQTSLKEFICVYGISSKRNSLLEFTFKAYILFCFCVFVFWKDL